jgi:type I restriction enzyme R subunit
MTGKAQKYLELTRGRIDDKAVEAAIDAFADQENREEFYRFYKELETLYEILSPSPDLRDYVEDFGQLSVLYQILRNAFRKKTVLYGDVARKTERLVRDRVGTYGLSRTTSTVKIDEKTLEAIKDSKSSKTSKVINLFKSIGETVRDDGDDNPYLKPIGDRAEAIQDAFDNRQITTQDALEKIEKLVDEIVKAEKEQKKTGFDKNTFAVYWTLKQEGIKESKKYAPVINSLFLRFPNYKDNPDELRQLKAEIYKLVLPFLGKDKMVSVVDELLKLNREK